GACTPGETGIGSSQGGRRPSRPAVSFDSPTGLPQNTKGGPMLHVRRTTDRTRLGGARAPLCAFVCCLFALGLVGPARAATNNIFTVAGTLTVSGSTGDGGPATTAKLNHPTGVAATADGGLLIADADNEVVRRVSPAGTITTVAGTLTVSGSTGDGGPATAAKLFTPEGVAATADGGFLLADPSNQAIRRVHPAGTPTPGAGPPP